MPAALAAVAGYQIIAGLHQAEMVGMQAKIQAQIDEFNAQQAEYDAWKAIGYGQTQMARYQSELDKAEGATKVSAAAEGVKLEGSLAEIQSQNQVIGLANLLDIENQARERALGYTRQSRQIRLGSQISQGQAKTQQAAIIGGAIANAAATGVKAMSTSENTSTTRSESGYSFEGSSTLRQSQPGSYLAGSSEDLGGTGYLGLP